MKSKTILSADEMLEILNSQWATVQDIMKIGAVGRNKARDIKNKIEAAIDWESARFTKPEKPLDAYDTWKKYYSDIDMEETLKLLGFWR